MSLYHHYAAKVLVQCLHYHLATQLTVCYLCATVKQCTQIHIHRAARNLLSPTDLHEVLEQLIFVAGFSAGASLAGLLGQYRWNTIQVG